MTSDKEIIEKAKRANKTSALLVEKLITVFDCDEENISGILVNCKSEVERKAVLDYITEKGEAVDKEQIILLTVMIGNERDKDKII